MEDSEYCAISAPEAAATAVTVFRLILVILIFVLLGKLQAFSRAGTTMRSTLGWRRNKLTNDDEDDSDSDGYGSQGKAARTDYNNYESQTNNSVTSKAAQQTRDQLKVSNIKFDFRNLFNFNKEAQRKNKSQLNRQQQQQQQQRRNSQPELLSQSAKARAGNAQQAERQRRHSDTCLAHLKLPPGPMGLPFLGYLPFVGREIHLTLTSLSERYGPIYQIFLGSIRVVVLNDASLVRQAFKQPVFSGRPDTQLTRILQGYGIVNSEGALWKEQRAFLHSALRKLGAKSLMSGSNGLEAKIQNQVKEFVNDLSVHAEERKPCQVRPMVARAVSSVVGSIVMNLTYRKYEEKEKFDRLIELMQEGFWLFTRAMPLDFIPIFKFFPGVSYAYKKMKKNRAETSAFFQGVADEHRRYLRETFNVGTTNSTSSLHPRSTATSEQPPQTTTTTTPTPAQALKVSTEPAAGSGNAKAEQSQEQEQQDKSLLKQELLWRPAEQQPQGKSWSPAAHNNSNKLAGQQRLAETQAQAQSQQQEQQQQQQQHVELENIVARDLVDAYILQQKKHETDGKENYFSDQQLVQIMSDIFSAGLETVTSTIEWSILFLILNVNCQEQIQDEIDKVIGRKRMPQLEDLSQMPYTEATIYEVLRRSNVVALGNAHATLDDASIGGYKIPKGTQVLPNLYGIHMNPKLWQEPDKFDPARFIVNEKAKKPDYFIPFSVGRRMCLGDVLAKMEVFLFLVGLLQKYDLSVAEEDRHCPPQVKGTIGVSTTPASFRVALSCRKTSQQPQQSTTTTTHAKPTNDD